MSAVVSLRDLVAEMTEIDDEHQALLDRRTGELMMLDEDERALLDNGHPDSALSEQQRRLREGLRSGDVLELPAPFERHEYTIVERFCFSLRDHARREKLLKAIRGPRAFRDFNEAVRRLGLLERWVGFRNREFEQIAVDWLEKNRIAYEH